VRLVLFDIDGTLVLTKGAGRRALGAALLRVYGTAGLIDGYDFRGKTDPRIVADLMGAAGLAPEAIHAGLGDCFECYARGLVEEIGDGQCVTLLPGVADLVRRLDATEGVVLGLLTGTFGAVAVAVATGFHPYAELEAEKPDLVFESFAEFETAAARLLGSIT
jgi:phosphoglycolate phosphatase